MRRAPSRASALPAAFAASPALTQPSGHPQRRFPPALKVRTASVTASEQAASLPRGDSAASAATVTRLHLPLGAGREGPGKGPKAS